MKLLVFATYREIVKDKSVNISVPDNSTISTLLKALIKDYPAFNEELFTEDEQLKPFIHIFVNGRNIIHLNGLETTFKSTDEIALIPPVGGG